MTAYAHTKSDPHGTVLPRETWEPLFTAFGSSATACGGTDCPSCRSLVADHGHIDKVAWWTTQFASSSFQILSFQLNAPRASSSCGVILYYSLDFPTFPFIVHCSPMYLYACRICSRTASAIAASSSRFSSLSTTIPSWFKLCRFHFSRSCISSRRFLMVSGTKD